MIQSWAVPHSILPASYFPSLGPNFLICQIPAPGLCDSINPPSLWLTPPFLVGYTQFNIPLLLQCLQHLLLDCQFISVQSLSHVRLFATLWTAAYQASLSITNTRSSPKLMSIESVMPSSHLSLRHPLLLLPPIPPSIRVFFNESTLHMRWPKYWSFSFSIIPSKEHPAHPMTHQFDCIVCTP